MFASCFFLGLLPLVPSAYDPISLAFAASFGFFLLTTVQEQLPARSVPASAWSLGLFYMLALLSVVTALHQGTSFGTWLRGLIPFLFLTSFIAYRGLGTLDDLQDAVDAIQLGACVWAVRIVAISGTALIQVLTGQLGRLTYVCMDTLVPFSLIGYLLAISNPSPRFARYRGLMLVGFGLLVVACAYRSHILLCMAATTLTLYRSHPVVLFRVMLGLGGAVLVAGWFATETVTVLWDNVWARFEDAIYSEDMGTRGWEIQYAWSQFLASPVWGNGLGHPIPVDVVHDFSFAEDVGTESDSVGYIHNVWLYMLMDLGVSGFLAYVGFFLPAIVANLRSLRQRDRYHDLKYCALLTVAVMLIYTSCQAAFRLIQFNVVLGLLLAVLSHPRVVPGARR
jgi:hypothetical protein